MTMATETVWKLVIFVVDGVENHCGIDIPTEGLADCSLAGVRIIERDHRSFPKGECLTFDMPIPDPESGLEMARRPGTLMCEIIEQERKERGWHLTPDAPFFVRTVRDKRSRDLDSVNCVEWVLLVLEHAGMDVPDDVLTPRELLQWGKQQFGEPQAEDIDKRSHVAGTRVHIGSPPSANS